MATLQAKPKKKEDLDRLQGVWEFVSGWREAELLIAGRHYTVKFKSGRLYMGSFRVEPTGSPKTMDLKIEEGPAEHRGKTSLAIYDLVGNMLRWCPADPGEDRPRDFPEEGDPRSFYIVFKRGRG